MLNSVLPTKKYLDKLHSIYDLDLFCGNTEPKLNLDRNLSIQQDANIFHPIVFPSLRSLIRNQKVNLLSLYSMLM